MENLVEDTKILHEDINKIMRSSYIDYSMSVIVGRALPDVRDGLKPVHRRILYDMMELGVTPDKPHRKSARIVGDVLGKYHPHGDRSVYDAMVRLAQEWNIRYPLVDGHGNFGSIEGDGAAAMRYTEARLAKVTQEVFLQDLDKNTVEFMPNFDETEREPTVLPVRIPNLLVNGADGIAVGMATSIPPHNLGETVDAVIAYMDNEAITTEQLMQYIQGPDFPTGGIVVNKDELLSVYESGVGKIRIRGRVQVEAEKGGRQKLVITEIPYPMIGANIGKFLNDICALVETKKTSDIVDISNQSSKEGIRIVLELKKGADVENLKNLLYKKTRLEDTFGVNMLAVADGRPETLGLKDVIRHHVEFQFELAGRKYETLLGKEREKREVQEGLIKAVDVIDVIIEILRGSKNLKQAKQCLIEGETEGIKFRTRSAEKLAKSLHFTERQATAILEMRLYKLIGLEIDALQKEHAATMKNIATYEDILNNYSSMAAVIKKDLLQIKKEYAQPRRTSIENAQAAVYEEKKPEEAEVVILMDRFGYIRSVDPSTYERNQEAAQAENRTILRCMNTDRLAVFTDIGRMHTVKVSDLPLGKFRDKGIPIDNLSNYDSTQEQILCVAPVQEMKLKKLLFVTAMGMCKLVDGEEFDVAKRTVVATKLLPEDRLVSVECLEDQGQIVLQSTQGVFLKFALEEIPEKKKAAAGVRGIRLAENDRIEQVYLLVPGMDVAISWKDKELLLNKLRLGKRDTKGVKVRG